MQLSRLRWGLKTRSISGKAVQIFRAVQLERHYSKEQIAEAYFTIAPYGGNVEGVRAAAFRWCGKSASELTLRESASLSVIPQSPTTRRPRNKGNPSLANAQVRLMIRLRAKCGQGPNELDGEFHLVPTRIPREIPHYARRVLRQNPDDLVIHTSINLWQQQELEQSIADFLDPWYSHGLRNASAVLVHAPTREIRASVGSAGFFREDISGQVDGTIARRSPGSTLKPFIYALALDAGIIHPRTLLDDAPRRFAYYNPENSDREFLGPIPADQVLRRSRNIPAIDLANRLPNGGLERFLRGSGVYLSKRSHGLALAIGATEMKLEDLAWLYAELAEPRQGDISKQASWLTLQALRSKEPSAPIGLSCKTGTSNGFRDAWACGVMGDWVLCIWVGHFSGRSMPGLFASKTAAPLLWQSVNRLDLPPREDADIPPGDVVKVPVCAISGDLAGPNCPHCEKSWFMGGVSPITSCKVHQVHEGKVVEVWSAERLAQFRNAGYPRHGAHTARNGSEPLRRAATGQAPKIRSPQSAVTYVIRPEQHVENTLYLEAHAGPEVQNIHWFADRRYLGATAPAEPLAWLPKAGNYNLQAMDDAGRSTSTTITVQLAVGE